MGKLTITIEVEGGVPTATIDDGTAKRVVQGLALFGTDSGSGDPWYTDFYRALTMQLAMRTCTRPNECRIAPEELEERWKTNESNPDAPAKSDCECEIGHCDHIGSAKNPHTPRGKKVAYVGAEGIVEDEPDPKKWN